MAVTLEAIEQMHGVADAVLRKYNGNIERALPEFLHLTTVGLTPDPGKLSPIMPSLEYSARQYLEEYAKETTMTETTTKRRMMAELMFDNPEARDLAIGKLIAHGFEIRRLDDWHDEGGTPTTWILAFLDYEGDQEEFWSEVESVVDSTECEVLEAGYSGSDADVEAWIAKKS